jgi:DNA-binding PadR family transcriptional regulator
MRAETIKGHLDLLLLAIVADGPMHGYAVIGELARRSGDALRLPEGTVYPALHRLEAGGLLHSSWVPSAGRRRRVYELTGAGEAALLKGRADWRDFVAAVAAVLGGPGVAPGAAAAAGP